MLPAENIAEWCTTLTTPRAILEPTAPRHAQEMFEVLNDRLLYAFIGDDPPGNVEELARRYESAAPRCSPDKTQGWYEWVIRIDGRCAGYVQATVYLAEGEIGLAYVLGSSFWGRGFTTEVCEAVLAYIEAMPGIDRFFIDTDVDNSASQRVAEKLGFYREGIRRNASTIRGSLRDDVRYVRRVETSSGRRNK